MNITDLLQLLTEDRSVDYINKTLEDKVPASVIDALSSKMKKGKYDNEAMAILKAIQKWESVNHEKTKANVDYLISHAGMVYSILKKYKNGKSDWEPEELLNVYISTAKNPNNYWKYKYAEAIADHPALSKKEKDYNTTGLKTARVKELSDCFAIFPKNYKSNETFTQVVDRNKSQEDIRKISAEIAAKDTSGKSGADVNHWCVATGDRYYYDHYKNRTGDKGIFIIIVEKDKNGAPDWNNRYLVFFKPSKGKKGSQDDINGRDYKGYFELADKFDDHLNLDYLPKGAQKFILKVAEDRRRKEKPDIEREVASRLSKAEEADKREVEFDEKATQYDRLYNEALNFFKEEERKGKVNQVKTIRAYLRKNLSQRGFKTFKDWGIWAETYERNRHGGIFFSSGMGGNSPATVEKLKNSNVWRFWLSNNFNFIGNSKEEIINILDKCMKDDSVINDIMDKNFRKRYNIIKLGNVRNTRVSAPNKEMLSALSGNKKLLNAYDKKNAEEQNRTAARFEIPFSNSQKEDNYIYVDLGYNLSNLHPQIPCYTFWDNNYRGNYRRRRKDGYLESQEDLEKMKRDFTELKNQAEAEIKG